MKTYTLMISRTFMKSHPRAGQETYFMSKILLNFNQVVVQDVDGKQFPVEPVHSSKMVLDIIKQDFDPKLHTLRPNYDLWAHRAEEINAGRAVLSLRQWTGKPYRSKQNEFIRLEKIGVQRAKVVHAPIAPGFPSSVGVFIDGRIKNIHEVAKNDGLSVDDFCHWFGKPLDDGCVIHFTENFRY